MIVEDEWRTNWPCEYDQIEELPQLHRNPTIVFNDYIERQTKMIDVNTHNCLRADLVEHI